MKVDVVRPDTRGLCRIKPLLNMLNSRLPCLSSPCIDRVLREVVFVWILDLGWLAIVETLPSSPGLRRPCDDWSLGTVHGCRGDFDLTLLTEYIFLSILPSGLFLVLTVARLVAIQVASRKNKEGSSRASGGSTRLQFYKLAAISCYGALQLVLLVLVLHNSANVPTAAAAVLNLITALTLALVSWVDHSRSLRPSTLINLYLLGSPVCDAIQTRTLWLRYFDEPTQKTGLVFASAASGALIIKTGLLFLESIEKPNITWSEWPDEKNAPNPEEKAGVLSRSLLIWVHGILSKERKTLISPIDLDPLREGLGTSHPSSLFWSHWGFSPGHLDPEQSISADSAWTAQKSRLATTLLQTLKWSLLASIIPRLCLTGFTFCQTLLLREFLRSFAGQPTFVSASTGYVFIVLYGVVYTGLAVSGAIYWRLVYKTLVQMRGCIISAVYEKTVLEIDPSRADMDAPVSLVSTDMERIISGVKDLHEIWANSLQAGLTIWLLYRELGLACVAPAAVAIISSLGSMLMSPRADKAQVAWMEATQERVGVMARAVGGMRSVKLLGLSEAVYGWLNSLRTAELHAARHFRYIEVFTAVIAFVPLFLSPVFTFLVFVVQARTTGEHLDVVKAFVTLSLLHLMTQPLGWLFQAVPLLVASIGCIDRVDKYLHGPSQKPSSGSEHESTAEHDAIVIRDGKLGWAWNEEDLVLSNVNITMPAHQLTLVVGPVASGKSTLAKAVVGQLPCFLGDIRMGHSGGVAFCDQEPFLMNDPIRANIVGLSEPELADPGWYDTVIRAVGLDKDLATFPDGSETSVGSQGTRLSGGQRQRVSIARALYSRKRTAVFDDVLSSLDAATNEYVFDNVLGHSGLLREMNCTVILFTHEVALLPRSDHIIVLGRDGMVAASGSFEELAQTSPYVQSLVIGNNSGTASGIPSSTTSLGAGPPQKPADEDGHDIKSDSPHANGLLMSSGQPPDDLTRRLGDVSIYKYLVHHGGLWRTAVFVLLTCGSAIFSTIGPVWLKTWCSDTNLTARSDSYYLSIYAVFQSMALLFLGLFAGFALTALAVKIGESLHQVLLSATVWAPMAFFSATDTGIITNRFSGDFILVDGDLAMTLLETLSSGLVAVVQMIYIAVAGPYVAIAYPVLLACLYFVQSFYLKTSRQLRSLDLEARSPLQSQLLETIYGLATIRSFSWSKPAVQKFQRAVDASQQPLYLLYMVQRWLQLVLEFVYCCHCGPVGCGCPAPALNFAGVSWRGFDTADEPQSGAQDDGYQLH